MGNEGHMGAMLEREDHWHIPGPIEVLLLPPYWLFFVGIAVFMYVVERSRIEWVYDQIQDHHLYALGIAILLVIIGSALYFWTLYSRILFVVNMMVLAVELCSVGMTFGAAAVPLGPFMILQILFFFYGLRKDPYNTLVPLRMATPPKVIIQSGFLLGTAYLLIHVFHVI